MKLIAMGGGGFSMEDTPWMDSYVLAAADREFLRVAFLGTASGDNENYALRFHRAFSEQECVTSDISLFVRTGRLERLVESQDVFYVGGGNTANLLAIWRTHDLHTMLKKAYESGAVLAGLSAGGMCWFEGGVTDSFGPLRPFHDGLGFISGGFCPHYDEPGRREAFHRWVTITGDSGYAADNGAALAFDNGQLVEAVTSIAGRYAYRVALDGDGRVVEERLPTRSICP